MMLNSWRGDIKKALLTVLNSYGELRDKNLFLKEATEAGLLEAVGEGVSRWYTPTAKGWNMIKEGEVQDGEDE